MEPPSYHHIHPAADELVQLAASHRLTLRSELGVPTFYVISDRMTNTTIDLVWTNQEAFDLTTTCITDVSLEHSYSSDHAAILSTTDLPDSQSPITPPPRSKARVETDGQTSALIFTRLLPLPSDGIITAETLPQRPPSLRPVGNRGRQLLHLRPRSSSKARAQRSPVV